MMSRARMAFGLAMVFVLTTAGDCPLGTDDDEDPPYDGFVGEWVGGESSGLQKSGTIKFKVNGNTITGEVAPISGSQRDFTGNIENGAIHAVIPEAANGCVVTLQGTITFANDGTGAGNADGTYVLTQSDHCNTNSGTWHASKAPN